MNNYIRQYKFIFIFPWVLFYLIYPTWALPVSVTARAAVFFGLMFFFVVSAYIMNRWFYAIPVDKPVIIPLKDIMAQAKIHARLLIVCCIAVILHIYPLSLPILILGDETQHLQAGLWIYEHIDVKWHRVFQIVFWALIVLALLIKKAKKTDNPNLTGSGLLSRVRNNRSWRFIFIFFILLFSVAYFLLLRNITYYPGFIHYPHLLKLINQIVYSAFGITHVGPRTAQLAFYIFSAVYLYRSIALFNKEESALMGATIFLFMPVLFAYARLAEISCGTLFFITLISFHFLRFIRQGDNRDLLLTSFFIGTGFMYRQEIFIMFFICTSYLIVGIIRSRDLRDIIHVKVMSLSLVLIIPWMIISKFFSWRNYSIIWSNIRPPDGKVFAFFTQFPVDISWTFFALFLLSIVYISVAKRNALTVYFGLVFIAYFFFLTLDIANYSPRLFMSLYPTVAVYLSLFLYSTIDRVRWKYFFNIAYLSLFIYMLSLNIVPSLNAQFLSSVEFRKLRYFPSDDAMKWVKENVKEGEKILILRIMSSNFYRVKYRIDKDRMVDFWYEIDTVSTPDNLASFNRKNKISYIMFPYNPEHIKEASPSLDIFEYLKNNPNKEFEEIAKYNLDGNYIYIVKFKETINRKLL